MHLYKWKKSFIFTVHTINVMAFILSFSIIALKSSKSWKNSFMHQSVVTNSRSTPSAVPYERLWFQYNKSQLSTSPFVNIHFLWIFLKEPFCQKRYFLFLEILTSKKSPYSLEWIFGLPHLRSGHVKILKRLSLSAEFWINFLWLPCFSQLSQ